MGLVEGSREGRWVGMAVGRLVGLTDGAALGRSEGEAVGLLDGTRVGTFVGLGLDAERDSATIVRAMITMMRDIVQH